MTLVFVLSHLVHSVKLRFLLSSSLWSERNKTYIDVEQNNYVYKSYICNLNIYSDDHLNDVIWWCHFLFVHLQALWFSSSFEPFALFNQMQYVAILITNISLTRPIPKVWILSSISSHCSSFSSHLFYVCRIVFKKNLT